MQLLGTYQSNLSKWYYNELISLVNSAISKGDYSGGYTFNQANISNIVAEGKVFTGLTLPEAGTRSLDEDFNNPLGLLAARFASITQEVTDFTANISVLIDILSKDTNLLDQLIYAAKSNVWSNSIPSIIGAKKFVTSFGVGFGKVGFNLSKIDPSNLVVYDSPAQLGNYFDVNPGVSNYGLLPASSDINYGPKNLTWTYDAIGFDEATYGENWAELDFLEQDILIKFNSPQLDILLPDNSVTSPFSISGTSTTKGIPIYVRTLFNSRSSSISVSTGINVFDQTQAAQILPGDQVNVSYSVNAANGTNGYCSLYLQYFDTEGNLVVDSIGNPVQTLVGSLSATGTITNLVTTSNKSNVAFCQVVLVENSVTSGFYILAESGTINTPIRLTNGYNIDPTTVSVFSDTTFYNLNQDFFVTGKGYVTLVNVPDETNIAITFVEYFPCYQCSINQSVWSQIIMFDYQRLYPDNETMFLPVPVGVDPVGVRNKLPIVDESGLATGLYISLNGIMTGEYLLKVYQDADSVNPGKEAVLKIDFGQPRYMNSLNLSSYTNFPVSIKSIDAQGFASNSLQNLYTGNLMADKPVSIRFLTTLISSISLTIFQENYTITQQQIVPDDYLRRKAINDLQAVIPVAAQEPNILPQVVFTNGYQYEFGIENISGSFQTSTLPTVFISGPYSVNNRVSTLTLNADYSGTVDFYLCYTAYNSNQSILDSNTTGIHLTPGSTTIFPYSSGTNLPNINQSDLYLKIVLRSADANVKAFMLQVD